MQVEILKNGLKVVYVENSLKSVTMCLRGLAGSNYERKNEIGVAHFLEHLSIRETSKSDVISKGGRITGTTSRDDVAFFVKLLKQDHDVGLKFLANLFYNPTYDQKNIEHTKKIIEHEILQNKENPTKYIERISYKLLYPGQRFENFNTGDISDIQKINETTLQKFRNCYYYPSNFVLTICGDVDCHKTVKSYFDLPGPPKIKQKPKIHIPTISYSYQIESRKNLKQTHLRLDYHGFSVSDSRKFAAHLLSLILKQELAGQSYVLKVAAFSSNSYGLFGMYTVLNDDKIDSVIKAWNTALDRVIKNKLNLEILKNKVRADFEFTLEKTSLKADYFSEVHLYNGYIADELNALLKVTPSDIKKVALYFKNSEPKITVLTNNYDNCKQILHR